MSETSQYIASMLCNLSGMVLKTDPRSWSSQDLLSMRAYCLAMEDFAEQSLRAAARRDTVTITGLPFQWDPQREDGGMG